MPPNNPLWLDVVRHRLRRIRAPYLLVVQHHGIAGPTRLAVPVIPPTPGIVEAVAPRLVIEGHHYHARMLDMTPVLSSSLAETVASALDVSHAITNALDIILYGYPVGRPH